MAKFYDGFDNKKVEISFGFGDNGHGRIELIKDYTDDGEQAYGIACVSKINLFFDESTHKRYEGLINELEELAKKIEKIKNTEKLKVV